MSGAPQPQDNKQPQDAKGAKDAKDTKEEKKSRGGPRPNRRPRNGAKSRCLKKIRAITKELKWQEASKTSHFEEFISVGNNKLMEDAYWQSLQDEEKANIFATATAYIRYLSGKGQQRAEKEAKNRLDKGKTKRVRGVKN
jgi:hypothetical protein